jgi:hypothetical protein
LLVVAAASVAGTSEPVHSFFIFNTEKARGPLRAAGEVSPCSNIET